MLPHLNARTPETRRAANIPDGSSRTRSPGRRLAVPANTNRVHELRHPGGLESDLFRQLALHVGVNQAIQIYHMIPSLNVDLGWESGQSGQSDAGGSNAASAATSPDEKSANATDYGVATGGNF
jgi:hypothetical protein